MAACKRFTNKVTTRVDNFLPSETRMAFQDGIQTGAKFVKKSLMYTGMAETVVMVKNTIQKQEKV